MSDFTQVEYNPKLRTFSLSWDLKRKHTQVCGRAKKQYLKCPETKEYGISERISAQLDFRLGMGIRHLGSSIYEAGKTQRPSSLIISHSHELVFVQHFSNGDKVETDRFFFFLISAQPACFYRRQSISILLVKGLPEEIWHSDRVFMI